MTIRSSINDALKEMHNLLNHTADPTTREQIFKTGHELMDAARDEGIPFNDPHGVDKLETVRRNMANQQAMRMASARDDAANATAMGLGAMGGARGAGLSGLTNAHVGLAGIDDRISSRVASATVPSLPEIPDPKTLDIGSLHQLKPAIVGAIFSHESIAKKAKAIIENIDVREHKNEETLDAAIRVVYHSTEGIVILLEHTWNMGDMDDHTNRWDDIVDNIGQITSKLLILEG